MKGPKKKPEEGTVPGSRSSFGRLGGDGSRLKEAAVEVVGGRKSVPIVSFPL